MRVYTRQRPYYILFEESGSSYPLSSEGAQRLIDGYPIVKANANRVTLRMDNGGTSKIYPATFGGGAAFKIERS